MSDFVVVTEVPRYSHCTACCPLEKRSPWSLRLYHISFIHPRASSAVLPCRAASVIQDAQLHSGDHPPAPGGDRLAVAELQPRPAGPPRPGLLRKGETFALLAAGFAVSTTTAWWYVNETVDLLAAHAPKLRQAIRDASSLAVPGFRS